MSKAFEQICLGEAQQMLQTRHSLARANLALTASRQRGNKTPPIKNVLLGNVYFSSSAKIFFFSFSYSS